jgi:membrane protein involved in colicin uptake
MPSFTVPRSPSHAKFGRTAGSAVAVIALLMLVGSGGQSTGPDSVQASAGAARAAGLSVATAGASGHSASAATESAADHTANAAAQHRAPVRAANARAERRAVRRAKLPAERRAAQARAEERRRARRRAAARAASASDCDPNYAGACLDRNASDYDCEGGSGDGPQYTGPVRVVGTDEFDLDRDRDRDGIGCDT